MRNPRLRRPRHGRGDPSRHGALDGLHAGALPEEEFRAGLDEAGFDAIEIEQTHRVHEHAASTIVRARRR